MNKKAVIVAFLAVGLLAAGLIIFAGGNDRADRPPTDDNKSVSITRKDYSYVKDLNRDLVVEIQDTSDSESEARFDVSFKQLACQTTLEYLGRDDLDSVKRDLDRYAEAFEAVRQDILANAGLPETADLVYGSDLAEDILNQSQDIYGNFRLLANYDHYVEQESELAVFDDRALDFIARVQVTAYAMDYASASADQPRPDLAYGITPEESSPDYFSNPAINVAKIQQDIGKYQICDLDYIYTNVSGQGLSSHGFGDICRSGSLPRPAEFSFVAPLIAESVAYVNETVNHPASWPIGYESLTEDCAGSHIERNKTHVRVIKFLMPADTNLDNLTIELAGQTVPLN